MLACGSLHLISGEDACAKYRQAIFVQQDSPPFVQLIPSVVTLVTPSITRVIEFDTLTSEPSIIYSFTRGWDDCLRTPLVFL